MVSDEIKRKLKAMGLKEAAPDHPIYSSGSMILFTNRSVVTAKQAKPDEIQDPVASAALEETLDLNNLPRDPALVFKEELEAKLSSSEDED